MQHILLTKLEDLKQYIETADISSESISTKEWGGADVIIKKTLDADTKKWLEDQPLVVSFQNNEPRRRAVITQYSKELSWLFYRLGQIFSEQLDYVSKYDFYGLLAQAAIDHLENNENNGDVKQLLIKVLDTSKEFCEDGMPS